MSKDSFYMGPGQLGLDGVDMQAVATTTYLSGPIPLEGNTWIRVELIVTETGTSTTGLATVQWQPIDANGSNAGTAIDLGTSINTKTSLTAVLSAYITGTKQAQNGTIGANAQNALVVGTGKLVVNVQEANNGTSSTADAHLWIA